MQCYRTFVQKKRDVSVNFGLPECSNRYEGKPVNFVVKAKVAKLAKLGILKVVTNVGAMVRLVPDFRESA